MKVAIFIVFVFVYYLFMVICICIYVHSCYTYILVLRITYHMYMYFKGYSGEGGGIKSLKYSQVYLTARGGGCTITSRNSSHQCCESGSVS